MTDTLDTMIDKVFEARIAGRIGQRLEALVECTLERMLGREAAPASRPQPMTSTTAAGAILALLAEGPATAAELARALSPQITAAARHQAMRRLVLKQRVVVTGRGKAKQYGIAAHPTTAASK